MPLVISWIWVLILLETLCNLLIPALIDREFLFETQPLFYLALRSRSLFC
jgi:hypothetical protein